MENSFLMLNTIHEPLPENHMVDLDLPTAMIVLDYWRTAVETLAYEVNDAHLQRIGLSIVNATDGDQMETMAVGNMLQAVIQYGMPALFAAKRIQTNNRPYLLISPENKNQAVLLIPAQFVTIARTQPLVALAMVAQAGAGIMDFVGGNALKRSVHTSTRATATRAHFWQTTPHQSTDLTPIDQEAIAQFPNGIASLPPDLTFTSNLLPDNNFNLLDFVPRK